MRAVLPSLLLVCLLAARALSDCRRDCLGCHRHLLHGHQEDFSLLICVMECEGKLVSRATWQLCSQAPQQKAAPPVPPRGLDSSSLEEEAAPPQPLETWDGSLLRGRGSLKRLGEEGKKPAAKGRTLVHQPGGAGAGASPGDPRAPPQDFRAPPQAPQRLGSFLSRGAPFSDAGPLEEPAAAAAAAVQELQKRFGGFIGVRKAARKWHNQKRFSEFLKQYLGNMAPRSVEYEEGRKSEQDDI